MFWLAFRNKNYLNVIKNAIRARGVNNLRTSKNIILIQKKQIWITFPPVHAIHAQLPFAHWPFKHQSRLLSFWHFK